jgi:hypothetical protein
MRSHKYGRFTGPTAELAADGAWSIPVKFLVI